MELREQGRVKAIGAGMNQWEMELQFAREGQCDCFLLAGRYTLLDQDGLTRVPTILCGAAHQRSRWWPLQQRPPGGWPTRRGDV